MRPSCRGDHTGRSWVSERQAKEALTKVPQTAVCGYFKSSLLDQANLLGEVVPVPILSGKGWTLTIHKLPFGGFLQEPLKHIGQRQSAMGNRQSAMPCGSLIRISTQEHQRCPTF